MRKGRPFLYMVVAYELEGTALRENCRFVIDRAIFETKEQAGGNRVTTDNLEEVAYRQYAAFFRPQREKAVFRSFNMAHRDRFRGCVGLQNADQCSGE